jgi:hypothetical protein
LRVEDSTSMPEYQTRMAICLASASKVYEVETTMPAVQLQAGIELLAWLKPQLPHLSIITGHKRWTATACPGQYFPISSLVSAAAEVPVTPQPQPTQLVEISQQIDRLLNQHQLMECLWQREDRKAV